ncbi:MAG TPA: PqqD family protein [Fimbriimonadales bacterium]|nr:PqqD family protein [Fimbriimonadales bacterium]
MGMAWLKFFSRHKQWSKKQIRKAKPLRNSQIPYTELESGAVRLHVPLNLRKGIYKWVARWTEIPPTRDVELEPIGAFVWKLCDGSRTLENIVERLRQEFKISKVEAEASLLSFMETLAKRGFIVLSIPEP